MIALEAWLLAAAVAGAKPEADRDAPPLELLEFIGDWSAEEQKLIEQAAPPKKKAVRSQNRKSNAADNDAQTRTGPPR